MLKDSLVFYFLWSLFIYNIQNFCLLWIFICAFPNLNKADYQSNQKQDKHKFSSSCKRDSLRCSAEHSKRIGNSHKRTRNHPEKSEVEHRFTLSKTKKIYYKALKTNIHIPAQEENHTRKNNNHRFKVGFPKKPNGLSSCFLRDRADLYQRENEQNKSKNEQKERKNFLIFGIIGEFVEMSLKLLLESLHFLGCHITRGKK